MNRGLFSKVISVLFALLLCVNVIPMSAFAHEPVYYPYMLYAHSSDDASICIESNGLCANGTIATNGAIVNSSPYTNGNLSVVEDSTLSMVHAHYAILNNYFEGAVLFTNDVIFDEMNNNISGKFGTDFSISAIGSTSLNGNIGAIYDITFSKGEYDSTFNASNSVIYSRMGNVTFECSNFSFGGLIFAPRGTVIINADNVNVNGIILADKIVITGSNVNLNYNQQYADVIGEALNNTSESIENDTIFEVEKNIILDTTYLSYCDNGYIVEDGFAELNGKLLMSSMFESLSVDVFDDLGINVFSQQLTPALEWSTANLGLLVGDNYVKITAQETNGNIIQKEYLIRCYTADFNDNLMIDRDDPDGDCLINYIENYFSTDINDADTDDDGLTDFQEIYDASTEPLLWDTDEDGICDGDEDNDNDGLTNGTEYVVGSYIYTTDSDMDSLSDYDEHIIYGTNPIADDTDGDTLTDAEELKFGTNPLLYDTNGNDISDANEQFTTIFDVTEMGISYDLNVIPSLCFTSDVKNTLSVEIETYSSDIFINPRMVGYIGNAYTFTSDQPFEAATMTFTLNEDFFEDEDFVPAIYYFNETDQILEKLPDQSISGNTISAEIEHFSTYIVLDSRKLDEVWEQDIDVSENGNVEIVFILDYSTSLDSNDPYGYRVSVAQDFIDRLNPEDKVGVVVFNHDYIQQPLTNDFQAAKNTLQTAKNTTGGTYLWNGVKAGLSLFDTEKSDEIQRYIILMSDGWSSDCSYYSEIQTEYEQLLDDKQIDKVFTIGLAASGCNSSLLQSMASNLNNFYKLSTASSANSFFTNTYDKINEDIEDERNLDADSNNDGITDNDTLLMCKGYITTGTGQYVFGDSYGDWEGLFDDIQKNDDFDGDGLINGDEVYITRMSTGQPIVIYNSDPTTEYTDNDKYTDRYEIEDLGTDPKVDETIYWDFDISVLADSDNGYNSDDYYERITGSVVLMGSAAIGNYCYGGKTDLTEIYRETIYDYIVYMHDSNRATHNQESLFDLLLEGGESCLEHYDVLWNYVKTKLPQHVTDAYIDSILPQYRDMKEGQRLLRSYGKNIPDDIADAYNELVQDSAKRYAQFVEDYNIKGVDDQIKLNNLGKISKYIGVVGNVISVSSCAIDNITYYKQLYDSIAFLEESKEALTIIADQSLMYDPLLAAAASEMKTFVENEGTRALQAVGTTVLRVISSTGKVVLDNVCQEAVITLLGVETGGAVFLGYAIGTFIGDKITPVSARSEFAVRVCAMTVISKILADEAAGATRYTLNRTPDRRIKDNGMIYAVWKTESDSGQSIYKVFVSAIYARMYAEQSVIDLLSEDTDGLRSVFAFLEGYIYYLMDEWGDDMYTHDKYDIIADCESKQTNLLTLRNKYVI